MKKRLAVVGGTMVGMVMMLSSPALAGGYCNGRVDAACYETGSGYFCTVYVAALGGCQIGSE